MKKVLIITYYWPPSGGAGVQRWLKLSKYLSQMGVEVSVLTVDPLYASFPNIDNSLQKDIPSTIEVYTTKATNYFKFYERAVGKENVPKAGYSNVDARKRLNRIVSSLRSHLFIPDPRKGWNRYAYVKAVELINEKEIDNVITTSPPHSTQLIGLKLKRKFPKINWIADLRDPWVDIYYYNLLGHSSFSKSIDSAYEKEVLESSDVLTTVSSGLKDIFVSKRDSANINPEKIQVITNGFDSSDFEGRENIDTGKFIVTYTGTMSEQYMPQVFFKAYSRLEKEYPGKCQLKFVGKLSAEVIEYAKNESIGYDFIAQVPHDEVIDHQLSANVLLLLIPKVENDAGIITGKLFEYLASQNPILVIGPKAGEAGKFVLSSKAGKSFSREDEEGIYSFLKIQLENYLNKGKELVPFENVKKFDRKEQAKQIRDLLK